MNPADLYTALMGGRYGPDQRDPPFVAGHDGIGVVLKVTITVSLAASQLLVLCRRAMRLLVVAFPVHVFGGQSFVLRFKVLNHPQAV